MKISPVATLGSSATTVGAIEAGQEAPTMIQKVRSLKMNVNRTPGVLPDPLQDPNIHFTSSEEEKTLDTSTKPATEDTQPLSPQLAALARQRRALQVKERELAERAKALESQMSQTDRIELAKIKSDPLGVLQKAGVSYDQLTEAVLNSSNGQNPEISELKAEIQALKEGFTKTFSDRDQKVVQDVLRQRMYQANQVLTESPDDFELIQAERAMPEVKRLLLTYYNKYGVELDVKEGMKLVEQELFNKALSFAKAKKVQSQFAQQQTQQEVPAQQMPQQTQRQMRTLTNRDTATVPLDRKQRALLAWSGQLKK